MWTGNWKLSEKYPIPDQSLETREIQLSGNNKATFLRFLRKMLRWLPENRAGAQELLFNDEWVTEGEY